LTWGTGLPIVSHGEANDERDFGAILVALAASRISCRRTRYTGSFAFLFGASLTCFAVKRRTDGADLWIRMAPRSNDAFVFDVCLSYQLGITRRADDAIGFTRFGRVVADDSAEAISFSATSKKASFHSRVTRKSSVFVSPNRISRGVFVLSPQEYFNTL
jgi:hypothetical protein